MHRTFVYGASGHGKVVADILLARNDQSFVGFVDDRAELHRTCVLGFPVLGDKRWLKHELEKGRATLALGVGDNVTRARLARECVGWGAELATLVHPSASVSSTVQLGSGSVVMAQAAINPDARIGQGSIINTGAVVEHDVVIGDFAHVAPNATLGGAAGLGAFSFLAMNATVLHRVQVGAHTIVGAGAIAVRDIPDYVVAFGVPAIIRREIRRQPVSGF